jgi:single-stranded DNA-binding protein
MKELTITGNAGGNPVKQTSSTGKEFINFSVAHYEGKTKDGQEIPPTWVDVFLASDSFLAPYVLNNVKKGVKLLIKGRNKISVYTNKQGQLAYSETIYPNSVEVFSFEPKTLDSHGNHESQSDTPSETVDNPLDNDIPFQS